MSWCVMPKYPVDRSQLASTPDVIVMFVNIRFDAMENCSKSCSMSEVVHRYWVLDSKTSLPILGPLLRGVESPSLCFVILTDTLLPLACHRPPRPLEM